MKKTILIAPADDAAAIAVEARAAGLACALAFESDASDLVQPDPARASFRWNPSSWASARALVLDATNAFGGVSFAVICPSFPDRRSLLECSPPEIEAVSRHALAGPLALFRELAGLRESSCPELRVALVTRMREDAADMERVACEAARAACESLADSFPEWCLCVADECPQKELTAQFVVKALASPQFKQGGKTIRFTGKSGLFGIL